MNRSLWAASCFLIMIGLLFMAGGVICQIYPTYLEPSKKRTIAKVVDLVLQESIAQGNFRSYKNLCYPVFEYYAEGKLYKVMDSHGSYPSEYHINQEVRITYDKEAPENYQLEKVDTWKLVAEALYVAGVICLCIGSIIFLKFARRG